MYDFCSLKLTCEELTVVRSYCSAQTSNVIWETRYSFKIRKYLNLKDIKILCLRPIFINECVFLPTKNRKTQSSRRWWNCEKLPVFLSTCKNFLLFLYATNVNYKAATQEHHWLKNLDFKTWIWLQPLNYMALSKKKYILIYFNIFKKKYIFEQSSDNTLLLNELEGVKAPLMLFYIYNLWSSNNNEDLKLSSIFKICSSKA